jgi:hypothetical protein
LIFMAKRQVKDARRSHSVRDNPVSMDFKRTFHYGF